MKRGKKYAEAAKAIDRAALYDVNEAVALVKKAAVAKFDRQSKFISEQAVTDVMRISRSVALSFFRMVPVSRFAYLYSLRMQRLTKQRLPALSSLELRS